MFGKLLQWFGIGGNHNHSYREKRYRYFDDYNNNNVYIERSNINSFLAPNNRSSIYINDSVIPDVDNTTIIFPSGVNTSNAIYDMVTQKWIFLDPQGDLRKNIRDLKQNGFWSQWPIEEGKETPDSEIFEILQKGVIYSDTHKQYISINPNLLPSANTIVIQRYI